MYDSGKSIYSNLAPDTVRCFPQPMYTLTQSHLHLLKTLRIPVTVYDAHAFIIYTGDIGINLP